MLKNAIGFFLDQETLQVDRDGKATSQDLQIAVVVLLAHTALSDEGMKRSELDEIVRVLSKHFRIQDNEAGRLLELSEFLSQDASRIDEFIQALRDNFDDTQKQILLGLVWKVIAADGVIDPSESSVAVEIRTKLGLTPEQAVRASQLAEEELAKHHRDQHTDTPEED